MFTLMSHYRSPLNYSGEILIQSKNALARLKTAKSTLEFIADNGADEQSENESAFTGTLPHYRERFIDALEDDFNTADAISVIFELVRESNGISSGPSPSRSSAKTTLEVFNELTDVLGLFYQETDDEGIDNDVEELIIARQAARDEKNWTEADRIRNKLGEMGIVLKDTPQGVRWQRNKS